MSSTPIVLRYPLDPTGSNPNNLVTGEIQTMPARTVRAIAPDYGAFYSDSLVITDNATNQVLTASQYYAAEMYSLPSYEFGQEICSIIMITDPTVSSSVSLQYQCLGGEYQTAQTAIIQQIYNLNLDDRPAAWPAIIGKPDAFPPSAHLHDAGDLYGFEYVTNALDRIRAAILLGDDASHDAIYSYIDLATSQINGTITTLQNNFNAHITNFQNPHQVTAAQVGAYTTAQSDANLNAAVTSLTTSINAVNAGLTSHENNFQNPHQVTAAQVGAWTVAQTQAAIAAAIATVTLGYTPVQQGGGASQLAGHKLYLGWDGSYPRLQVDSTDVGELATMTILNANVTNLTNAINGKAPSGSPYAYTGIGQGVSFGGITSTGNINADGTIFSNNDIWAFASDERLKKNIQTIKNALAKVHELTGVTYDHHEWAADLMGLKPKDRERRYMGLLAGQVNKVAPEIIGPAPFDLDKETGQSISGENYITLQYEKLTALLVEAVKEVDLKLDSVIRAVRRSGLGLNMGGDVTMVDREMIAV